MSAENLPGDGQLAVEQGPASEAGHAEDQAREIHDSPVQAPVPAELPVDSLREAAPFLRRPFTPEAIKFKIQAGVGGKKQEKKPPTGGIIVAYIDARLVVERLNLVCPHLWEEPEYVRLDESHLLCRLTIDGMTRGDVGETSRGGDSGVGADPIKALYSDAFKRAAVKFGVGVSVYALPQVYLPVGKNNLELQGMKLKALSDGVLSRLRGGYAKWLEATGEERFGQALDHGDTLDPVAGEVAPDVEPEDEPAEVAEGPEADGLREQVKGLYDELRAIDPAVVTPAEYGKRRREAEGSVEGLADLAGFLLSKLDAAKKVAV